MQQVSMEEVLNQAIWREEIAHSFYINLMDRVEDKVSKDTLLYMAHEELAHKEKVEYLYCNADFPQTDGG